jgi:5-methylcytosine-specific restriction endonuclease McrA
VRSSRHGRARDIRKDTKARSIPKHVKEAVAARDSFDGYPCCVACGLPAPPEKPTDFACAHFIARSQGGLGITENIISLCPRCHRRYDQSTDRAEIREYLREYLQSKHPEWCEENLIYKKENNNAE